MHFYGRINRTEEVTRIFIISDSIEMFYYFPQYLIRLHNKKTHIENGNQIYGIWLIYFYLLKVINVHCISNQIKFEHLSCVVQNLMVMKHLKRSGIQFNTKAHQSLLNSRFL